MCQVFHQYGALLAPITAAIHTAKYCDFSARQTDFRESSYQAIPQDGISRGDAYPTTADTGDLSDTGDTGDTGASSGVTYITDHKESN